MFNAHSKSLYKTSNETKYYMLIKIKLLIFCLFVSCALRSQIVLDTCHCSVLGVSYNTFVNPYPFGLDLIDNTDLEIAQGYKDFFGYRYEPVIFSGHCIQKFNSGELMQLDFKEGRLNFLLQFRNIFCVHTNT